MRNRSIRAPLPAAALLAALALVACAGGTTTSSPPDVSPDPSPTDETSESAPPVADISEAGLAELVARAAEEAGVAIDEVRVVTAEEVTWPDGSLGCPAPGMAYTQALVPGYRVVVEVNGEELHFHAAQGGEFQFCADPQPPVEGTVDR